MARRTAASAHLMLAAIFAVATLVVPVVHGQDEARSSPRLQTPAALTSVAVASEAGWVVAGTQDVSEEPLSSDNDVWFLWDDAGSLEWAGGARGPDCSVSVLSNCQGHVVAVAISREGDRIAVASVTGPDTSQIVRISNQGGIRDRLQVTGTITDMDMDATGDGLGITVMRPITEEKRGALYFYAWTSTTVQWADTNLVNPATSIDVSDDGFRVLATAGKHLRYNAATGQGSHYTVLDEPVAVAGASDDNHWSVAAFGGGEVAFFNDELSSVAAYSRRPIQTAQTATAIRLDGSMAAFGDDQGVIRMYGIDQDAASPVSLATTKGGLGGAVNALAFSADGEYLVAGTDSNAVHFFRVGGSALHQIWQYAGSNPVRGVDVDEHGETVVVAAGMEVYVFEAQHTISTTVAPVVRTVPPTANGTYTLSYGNVGSRLESVELAIEAPTGWNITSSHSAFDVAPGQTVKVDLTVAVPARQTPGSFVAYVNHTLASGGMGSTAVKVEVPVLDIWRLEPIGSSSRAATAGQATGFLVRVINDGNREGTRDVEATIGAEGWTVVAEPRQVLLAAGASRELQVRLTAPDGAKELEVGRATVSIKNSDARLQLVATVGARFGLDLSLPSGLELAQGATMVFDVTARNEGNAVDSFTVTSSGSPPGWIATFTDGGATAGFLDVPGGEASTRSFRVIAPVYAEVGTSIQVLFEAVSAGDSVERVERPVLITVTEGEGGLPVNDNASPGAGFLAVMVVLAGLGVAMRRRA